MSFQSFFDSRMKAGDFPKDIESMYDTSAGKQNPKVLASQEASLSFDRRQMDISNFDTDFDFPAPSRDFGTSPGRMDLSTMHRSAQQLNYHPDMVDMEPSHVN